MKKLKKNGFTLIEVLIVVAIVGLLAAIAYPSYTSSILKGRRAQGRTALAELLQQQERYMTQRNCYLGFTTASTGVATASAPSPTSACGGVTATSVPFKTFSGDSLAGAAYLLSAETCPISGGSLSIAECVRIVATPIRADSDVGALSITSTGTKACSNPASDITPTFSLCWP
jgi:type IV pilus assembly protein PilE